jgi:hypothetical protein
MYEADLGYGFQPRGHSSRVVRNAVSESSMPALIAFYCGWLDRWGGRRIIVDNPLYDEIVESVPEGLRELSPQDATAALFSPRVQERDLTWAGALVSAIQKYSSDSCIVYDETLDRINCIGYGSEKIIINKHQVGMYFGERSSGYVVNVGDMGSFSGLGSSGIVINLLRNGDALGYESTGVCINTLDAGKNFQDMGLLSSALIVKGAAGCYSGHDIQKEKDRTSIKPFASSADIPKELVACIDQLIGCARDTPGLLEEQFGPAPALAKELKRMVRG